MYAVKKKFHKVLTAKKLPYVSLIKNLTNLLFALLVTSSKLVLFTLLFHVLCPEKEGPVFQTALKIFFHSLGL
jgi:hypothetical protein